MVSGDFANYESETGSPNGIANVSILTAPGTVQDVYEDDFVRATFPDTGGADDAGK